jgi:hypothetical protein
MSKNIHQFEGDIALTLNAEVLDASKIDQNSWEPVHNHEAEPLFPADSLLMLYELKTHFLSCCESHAICNHRNANMTNLKP